MFWSDLTMYDHVKYHPSQIRGIWSSLFFAKRENVQTVNDASTMNLWP